MRHNVIQYFLLTASIVLVTACGGIPVIDNSPRMEAAVRIENVKLSGSRGYFAYEGTQTTWTHLNRRRVQQKVDFTESALGSFGASARRSYLYDLRVPELQQIDYDAKVHHKCDLPGCFEFSSATRTVEPQLPIFDGQSCDISIESSELTLIPAQDQSQKAGGQPFRFSWSVELRDEQQRSGSSVVAGILWLGNAPDREAIETEHRFEQAYSNHLKYHSLAMGSYLPSVPMALVDEYFLSTLDAKSREKALTPRTPTTQPGVVLAGDLQWRVSGPACGYGQPEWLRRKAAAARDEENSNKALNTPPGDGVESFGDFLSAMATELSSGGEAPEIAVEIRDDGEPDKSARNSSQGKSIFKYQWQLQTLVMGEVSADQLTVPANFSEGTRF